MSLAEVSLTPELLQTAEMLKALIVGGIATDPVVERVIEAVLNQRFYILTHEGSEGAVEQRMQQIVKGENPQPPVEGIGVFAR